MTYFQEAKEFLRRHGLSARQAKAVIITCKALGLGVGADDWSAEASDSDGVQNVLREVNRIAGLWLRAFVPNHPKIEQFTA